MKWAGKPIMLYLFLGTVWTFGAALAEGEDRRNSDVRDDGNDEYCSYGFDWRRVVECERIPYRHMAGPGGERWLPESIR